MDRKHTGINKILWDQGSNFHHFWDQGLKICVKIRGQRRKNIPRYDPGRPCVWTLGVDPLLKLSLSYTFLFKNVISESDISAVNSVCIVVKCTECSCLPFVQILLFCLCFCSADRKILPYTFSKVMV